MMAKAKLSIQEEIHTVVTDLLSKLQVDTTTEIIEEAPDHFKVVLQTQESGLLIGRHGETINSLQLLLGVILFKKLGQWIHIVVDVGDYRKMREDSIKEMVNRVISEVQTSGEAVTLPYLTPLERRIVHVFVGEHENLVSESTGEGKERRVTIRLRS